MYMLFGWSVLLSQQNLSLSEPRCCQLPWLHAQLIILKALLTCLAPREGTSVYGGDWHVVSNCFSVPGINSDKFPVLWLL